MYRGIKRIHMIGIGGSGMSGIAELLIKSGYKISGSDLKRSDVTERLEKLGAKIYYTHNPKNVKDAEVVVYSSAIGDDNPELVEAHRRGILTISRGDMLCEVARLKYTIAVSGTHGKTTTASLIGLVLHYGGFDPTVVVGGVFRGSDTGARLGKGDFMVAETDESDGSFLKLSPAIVVVTNIDNDHLNYYKTMKNLRNAFLTHINSVPFYGCAFLCSDDENIRNILSGVRRRYFTYSMFDMNAHIYANNIVKSDTGYTYRVFYSGKKVSDFSLRILGLHNVLNSLSAIGVGLELGIGIKRIKQAIADFRGVKRRIELKGEINGVKLIDDYGHHPTEIRNTLRTVREFYSPKRLIVVFQPHRYTRTKLLYKDFGKAFDDADMIFLTDIFPAAEKPIKGVSHRLILNELRRNKKDVREIKLDDAKEIIRFADNGDVILTLGAGDVYKFAELILGSR